MKTLASAMAVAVALGLLFIDTACSSPPSGATSTETTANRPADYERLFPLAEPAHFAFRTWKDYPSRSREEDRDYYFALEWKRRKYPPDQYYLTAVVKRAVEPIVYPGEPDPELGEIKLLTWRLDEDNCPSILEIQRRLADFPMPATSIDPFESRGVLIHPRVYQFFLSTAHGAITLDLKDVGYPCIEWAEAAREMVHECLK